MTSVAGWSRSGWSMPTESGSPTTSRMFGTSSAGPSPRPGPAGGWPDSSPTRPLLHSTAGWQSGHRPPGLPLAWFAGFRGAVSEPAGSGGEYRIGPWRPEVTDARYGRHVDTIREFIRVGDTYQTNYTFRLRGRVGGDLKSLYTDLLGAQGGAVITHSWRPAVTPWCPPRRSCSSAGTAGVSRAGP